MKYLIMESKASYAVALDEEGRFVKVPNLGYEVGQTVEDAVVFGELPAQEPADAPVPRARPTRRPARPARRRAAMLAAAACVVAFAVTGFAVWSVPAGTISIKINPAVSMDVNRFDRVVALRGDNADGRDLIAGYGFYGKRAEEVADELAMHARESGYLKPGGRVLVGAASDDAGWRDAAGERLVEALRGDLDDDVEIELDDFELDLEDGPDRDDDGDGDDGDDGGAPGQGASSSPALLDDDDDDAGSADRDSDALDDDDGEDADDDRDAGTNDSDDRR